MDSNYVIAHRDGGFLYRTNNNAWDRTPSFQKASRLTYEKASKAWQNSISSVMRDMWEVISVNDIDKPANYEETPFDENAIDWYSISKKQYDLYKNITQYRISLNMQLSNIDKEICDIQHYIEFFSLDAAKGYKAYRMLKERLTKRRNIKDELYRSNYFITGTAADFSDGTILKKIKSLRCRQYKPRVLSELFDLECESKCASTSHS